MTTPGALSREQVVKMLVDKFLAWPLPDSVCSDLCATKRGYPHRSGTSLLTADEAKQMLEYLLVEMPDAALRATIEQQAQELQQERDKCDAIRNRFLVDAASWRGVDEQDLCAECGGAGTKLYGNTSTYHYSAGGQAMTLSVCDKCWGSGNKHKPWRSWKLVDRQAQELHRHNTLLQLLHFIVEHDGEFDDAETIKAEAEAYGIESVLKLKQQVQEIERLDEVCKERLEQGQQLHDQLAAMTRERDDAVESTYVPGSWSCPVCQFAQVNSVLCAASGRVGADTESVPLCPNDGALMKRETWKGYVVAYEKSLAEKLEQLAAAQARCKELERQIDRLETASVEDNV